MIRNALSVLLGLFVGSALNMAIVLLMMVIWPLPEGVDMSNPEQMAVHVATMPVIAWLMAMVAHLTQAFGGGWVAARVGGSHPMMLALIVGGLSMIGGILNGISLNMPMWMWIELPLYWVVAAIAGRLEQTRRVQAG